MTVLLSQSSSESVLSLTKIFLLAMLKGVKERHLLKYLSKMNKNMLETDRENGLSSTKNKISYRSLCHN